jgi:hypothetical protein
VAPCPTRVSGVAATPALLDKALATVAAAGAGLVPALATDTAPQEPRTAATATSPVMTVFLN